MEYYLIDDTISSTPNLFGYLVVVGGEVAKVSLDLVVLVSLADLWLLLVGRIWLLLFLFICHQLLYHCSTHSITVYQTLPIKVRERSAGPHFPSLRTTPKIDAAYRNA